ncbi:hypothetical protein LCGC14_2044480 [marine sediment metagenome]|uniref:Uncharacterized protein n=1 Tax=marine sediment metagenome TaxID=412755 RepID=A0A0F9ER07_9ZZZZ
MVLKEDLEKQLEAANKLIRDYRSQERVLGDKIRVLESEIISGKEQERVLNDRFENIESMMQTIIKILAGEANGESKAAVITDLLKIRVDRLKEELKYKKQNIYHNQKEYY